MLQILITEAVAGKGKNVKYQTKPLMDIPKENEKQVLEGLKSVTSATTNSITLTLIRKKSRGKEEKTLAEARLTVFPEK